MSKIIFTLVFAAFRVLLATCASAQEIKPAEPPQPAMNANQELMFWWHLTGVRIVTMAEEFPEDKYDFKAQKDERTFGGILLHIAAVNYAVVNTIKGTPMGYTESDDSLRKIFPTKTDIVKFVKQSFADGEELIKAQGDSGFMRVVKYPWANQLVHASFFWWSILWHSGDEYGQLAVYYRLNGLIPPESRPRKK